MRVVHVTPGTGGIFYCQNCFRDSELIKSLVNAGLEIYKVPMYLPLYLDCEGTHIDTPVFYGAINVYLKEKLSLYRYAPKFLSRLFDSQLVLRFAAKKSGSTRAKGLEEMTLSMLRGEGGRQADELAKLIQYLKTEVKPDIVHISNALLLGLVRSMKQELNTKIVCSLQDENEWVDPMDHIYQDRVWNLMAEKAIDADLFVAASRFYADKSQKLLHIPSDKIKIIFGGINHDGYKRSKLPLNPPVIGYLCRMGQYYGFDIVVDAFIALKNNTEFKNTRLHITGGYTIEDKHFVKAQLKKIAKQGFIEDVQIFDQFDKAKRIDFLKDLTLLTVPVPSGESFGAYQVEALAAGVPIVQPNVGCYPEFIENTGGGVVYDPNNSEVLANTIESLLSNSAQIKKFSDAGYKAVRERFTLQKMAREMVDVYKQALSL